jgi:hypothetical protein
MKKPTEVGFLLVIDVASQTTNGIHLYNFICRKKNFVQGELSTLGKKFSEGFLFDMSLDRNRACIPARTKGLP